MRLAGAPDSSPPIVTGTLDAVEGSAYTAAGLGPRAQLAVRVLSDDLTPAGAGQARIRVVQGAEQAGTVAIGWNSARAFDGVAFGTATDYVTVPAGSGSFDVRPSTGPAAQVPVRLAPGGVYSVVLVQRSGRIEAQVATDASGAGEPPAGGIDTGMGGTAPGGPGTGLPGVVALVAAAAVALAGAGVAARRHPARRSR